MRILIVEDSNPLRLLPSSLVAKTGHEVVGMVADGSKQVRKSGTWPILFMHPIPPEAEAIDGIRLNTVNYLSHALARSQDNVHAVVSPVFTLFEGGPAYNLLKEVVRQPQPHDRALNFFDNTMTALLVIRTDAHSPTTSAGKNIPKIGFTANFVNSEGLIFSQPTALGFGLEQSILPKFNRTQHINNASQEIVVNYSYHFAGSIFCNPGAIATFCLLSGGSILPPWLTLGHYQQNQAARIAHEKSNHLATHDLLIDLPNPFLFNDRLKQAVQNWKRNASQFAVMLIDLDHFKEINDNFDRETGDQVLCEAAKRMTAELCSFDSVAGYDGDEFIILLSKIIDTESTRLVGEKITQR